jgi:hypothetical protein
MQVHCHTGAWLPLEVCSGLGSARGARAVFGGLAENRLRCAEGSSAFGLPPLAGGRAGGEAASRDTRGRVWSPADVARCRGAHAARVPFSAASPETPCGVRRQFRLWPSAVVGRPCGRRGRLPRHARPRVVPSRCDTVSGSARGARAVFGGLAGNPLRCAEAVPPSAFRRWRAAVREAVREARPPPATREAACGPQPV